jgi:hypothetical protein
VVLVTADGTLAPVDIQIVGARPTWQRLSECPACVIHRPNLIRTALTAAVVGVVLFCINHLDPVLRGHTSPAVWVGTGLSFVVPFCVANLGVLAASRRPRHPGRERPVSTSTAQAMAWRTVREAVACVVHRRHLLRTLSIALVVGTIYFAVNQLAFVVRGAATTQVWVGGAVTYFVPFTVANIGVLFASERDRHGRHDDGRGVARPRHRSVASEVGYLAVGHVETHVWARVSAFADWRV